jgi:hypothetical protein
MGMYFLNHKVKRASSLIQGMHDRGKAFAQRVAIFNKKQIFQIEKLAICFKLHQAPLISIKMSLNYEF